jgi:hypothetical protein
MAEYAVVEKPFLDQLASLGWQVIKYDPGVPTSHTKASARASKKSSSRTSSPPFALRNGGAPTPVCLPA